MCISQAKNKELTSLLAPVMTPELSLIGSSWPVGYVPFLNQSWWPEEKELRPETCSVPGARVSALPLMPDLSVGKRWFPPDKIWSCGQKKQEGHKAGVYCRGCGIKTGRRKRVSN